MGPQKEKNALSTPDLEGALSIKSLTHFKDEIKSPLNEKIY